MSEMHEADAMTTYVNEFELSEVVLIRDEQEYRAETKRLRLTSPDSKHPWKGQATIVSELTMFSTTRRL